MIKLMIVDDELASRKVIKAFLDFDALGIGAVTEASNGWEAMELIRSEDLPQIVISDMEMPVVGGIQFLDFLADCHPEIKVVVVSGYFDFRYTHAAITTGAQDYILKPIDPGKLRSAVQACIEAIHREAQLPLVMVGEQELDTGTYKAIIKESEQLRTLLGSDCFDCVKEKLERVRGLIQASAYPKAAEHFGIQLLAHILHYYCVAHDHSLSEPAAATLDITNPHSFFGLAQLYEETLSRIKEEKNRHNIEAVLEKIKDYIDVNYHLPLRLEEIADFFYVNKEYMSTVFHRKYGLTISAYILELKMEESMRLLKNNDIPIRSIAQMLGYEDPAYFNRVFKKYTGYSPGQYRAKQGAPECSAQ
uniref:Putative transcriptional regulator n=1 Tax=termite gut metagenome TaxID=433724 RepID=S0DET8_9ZZZZ